MIRHEWPVTSRKPPSEGVAKGMEYETWEEVWEALGETKALEILNAQVKTNAMNEARASLTKGPTKSVLRSEAVNEIMLEVSQGEHTDVIGNKPALDALVAKRMAEIEERMRAEVSTSGGVTEDSEEEEELVEA